jgi:phytoene dehydrogenase-like protein
MRDLSRNIDVAIVGGGLAGLTAAALLAQEGQTVALFERSATLGGRATTHVERGFHFNLGAHAWLPAGPGTGILSRLGISVAGRVPRPEGAFAIRDGRLHTLPIGFVSLLTTNLLGVGGKLETAQFLAGLTRLDTSRFDKVTLARWLKTEIADDRTRDVLAMFMRVAMYANAPEIMSAGASLAALQAVLRENVSYLHGGWQSIVDALESKAAALGVRIVRAAPVAKVLYDESVTGLRLDDGEIVVAPHVVLAVPPVVARHLVTGLPSAATARWDTPMAKAACLDVALSRLPKPGHTVVFGVDVPLYYSVHSATAALAPPGGALIHLVKYLDPAVTPRAEDDRRELEALLDLLQPGWRSEVVVQRYLPSMTVSHAIPAASTGGLRGRAPVAVEECPGLFVAGDWVGDRGILAQAALSSAAAASSRILERSRNSRSHPSRASLHDRPVLC